MKYMIFNKISNKLVFNDKYDTEQKCRDDASWDSGLYYICEFADDYDFSNLLKPTVISKCAATDDKNFLVKTFMISYDVSRHNEIISSQTFDLIKDWCREQKEGCEEAFHRLGVDDKTGTRYQEYLTEIASIKTSQTNKKL